MKICSTSGMGREKCLRYTLVVCLVLLAAAAPAAADEVLVEFGAPMRYLANSSNPGLGLAWTDPSFDVSGWTAGAYGVGFESLAGAENLILTDVPSTTKSVYTRAVFEIPDIDTIGRLFIGADRDDAWAAWINGVEVYRSPQLPAGPLEWDSSPSTPTESSNGATPNYGDLVNITSVAFPHLVEGSNDLAVAVWNVGPPDHPVSSDLVVVPYLAGTIASARAPYVQLTTPTSTLIRWRTDTPTDSLVLYGAAPGDLTNTGTPVLISSLNTEHIVEIDGLAPGTRYYYAVGSTGGIIAGDDADHFFETHPVPGPARDTRIWVIGDSGTAGPAQLQVRDSYLAFADGRHTDLWLHLGDVSQTQGTDEAYEAEFFDAYPGIMRQTALWPTMGNHDAGHASSTDLSGPYYDNFSMPSSGQAGGLSSGTEAYYSFDYANMHFVVLNSMDVDRSVDGEMLTWLVSDLASTDKDWIIAYWHHPPYSKGSHDSDDPQDSGGSLTDMRQNALPILEDYGVDLALSGHSHSYERSFLLDGHYGTSDTLLESMKIDDGDGRETGDGAYQKLVRGTVPYSGPGDGTVYTVAGSAGITSGGTLDHPVMITSLNVLGSLVLDVDGLRLDARFVDNTCGSVPCDASVRDSFTIIKECPSGDVDGDGVCGERDNCPDDANPEQEDTDEDTLGDACDPCPLDVENDADGDTVCEIDDNCPFTFNDDQTDTDGDGDGNACDSDDDADTIPDAADCAPISRGISSYPGDLGASLVLDRFGGTTLYWERAVQAPLFSVYRGAFKPGMTPLDDLTCMETTTWTSYHAPQIPPPGEMLCFLIGGENICGPGTLGPSDEERVPSNPCVPDPAEDYDFDGVPDLEDNCSQWPNVGQQDADLDFVGDQCDNCVNVPNAEQTDCNSDGQGDLCDGNSDCDFDGVSDAQDNCPAVPNADQANSDGDAAGDACDPDDDNDNVGDVFDQSPLDPFACRDIDGDACDDCSSGVDDPANDGTDNDLDGLCDLGDADDDNDGVPDESDSAPLDNTVCRDVDGDGCDDCSSGTDDPANDGTDTDSDGACDVGDIDDDNDGVVDPFDDAPLDPLSCRDDDFDTCDDCSSGYYDPSDDGTDTDSDGLCDLGDADDDNDGVPDESDSAPLDNTVCRDVDGDGCDDCSSGTDDPANDGLDTDSDGLCNFGDTDDDNDGVDDLQDPAPQNPDLCGDADSDTCDDCVVGTDGYGPLPDNDPQNDGTDTDTDGLCDLGDADDDNDGVGDTADCRPLLRGVSQVPESVGTTLVIAKTPTPQLQWTRSFQGHTTNVYSGGHVFDQPWYDVECESSEVPETHAETSPAAVPGELIYYLVGARNTCGDSAIGQTPLGGPVFPSDPCGSLNADTDSDGVPDLEDNCPLDSNPLQEDSDGDFVGDACD